MSVFRLFLSFFFSFIWRLNMEIKLDELIAIENEIRVTNNCIGENCSNCGECCGDALHVSKKELKAIRKYIIKHKIKLKPARKDVHFDLTCPFRDNENKKCLIYNKRPLICHLFKCNQDIETIRKNRDYVSENFPIISFRNEFKDLNY